MPEDGSIKCLPATDDVGQRASPPGPWAAIAARHRTVGRNERRAIGSRIILDALWGNLNFWQAGWGYRAADGNNWKRRGRLSGWCQEVWAGLG